MPRQKNTRPTSIYWLYDAQTGLPFYCGKTIKNPTQRLVEHKSNSPSHPNRPLCARLIELGDNVRVQVVLIVPYGQDWRRAEHHWIWRLRSNFPDVVNVSNGGDGVPGYVPSAEVRAKMRAAKLGKPRTPETRAKIAIASASRKHSAEARAKMSAIARLRPSSFYLIVAAASKRKKPKRTPEQLERARLNWKPPSAEARAKMSSASAAYWGTPENRKIKSEAFTAYWAKKRALKNA